MNIPENIESLPLFFIMGRPRSGTTMLRSMFDAHPNVTIPPEFPVLASVIRLAHDSWKESTIDEFVSLAVSNRKFANIHLSADEIKNALKEKLADSDTFDFSLAFKITNALFVSAFEKNEILAIGDKNPVYSLYIQRLRLIFPEAKFIFLRRHLFSVVDSVYKTNFELHWPAVIAWQWKKSFRFAQRDLKQYSSFGFDLKYEDLVANPEKNLRDLCEFIQIPFSDKMLLFNSENQLAKTYGDTLKKAHASLLKDIHKVKIPEWKTADKIRYKVALVWAGKSLTDAGYNHVLVRFKWFWWLRGLPYFIFFFGIKVMVGFLRFITRKKFSGNIPMRLAGVLYGDMQNHSL
ncbi:MAG: sulfotransferase [Bacteroidales bacterium]|nr:sulfotransferase [Bacteroidales bacterium]